MMVVVVSGKDRQADCFVDTLGSAALDNSCGVAWCWGNRSGYWYTELGWVEVQDWYQHWL